MSPRRHVDPGTPELFVTVHNPPRRWGLPLVGGVCAVVLAAIIGACTIMAMAHESDRRTERRDASALAYVRDFMTVYTTMDPFHANDYADRIKAQGTGEFVKQFTEKQNEIVIQVARAEPTTGTVLAAGVQRWNDNGSADVLVATKMTSKTPDGKQTIETGSRWLATTIQEGRQWKISRLIQVI
ncbi:mammalian cell entry protein [Mycolicibacterium cosmeticum]|uniref:MCE associated protein n=1 Tax=Mycolicibacterium cosmeticum TaxID=258533 RepID=W9B0R5_MYCCO|nr:mammalian cell entry protein [Mycolicibacterium cosmeticum]TLH65494.1 mammalian cell entry protein [Mycolicibacterium cosmeticum]CDO08446.1 MCE associated protein [Mycolicibacterium cosmeticum]